MDHQRKTMAGVERRVKASGSVILTSILTGGGLAGRGPDVANWGAAVAVAVSRPPRLNGDSLVCFPSNSPRPLLGAGQGGRRAGTGTGTDAGDRSKGLWCSARRRKPTVLRQTWVWVHMRRSSCV
jgi:hypothetical protein